MHRIRPYFRATAVLIAIASAPTVLAQPAADPARVEIRANGDSGRQHDTAARIIVNHAELVRFGDTQLGDVLKRLPGVTVDGGIRLRGLGGGYTQILLNGDPAPPGFNVQELPPDTIERVEIIRAALAEFSTQAVAGTINIVTRRSVRKAQREAKLGVASQDGLVSADTSLMNAQRAHGTSSNLTLALSRLRNAHASDALMTETDAAGTTEASHSWLDSDSLSQSANLSARFNLELAGGDALNAQSYLRHQRVQNANDERSTAIQGDAPEIAHGRSRAHAAISNLSTTLHWLRHARASASIDAKLGLTFGRRDNDTVFIGNDRSGRLALGRHLDASTRDNGITATGKYSAELGNGHAAAFGWDGGFSQRRDRRRQTDIRPAGSTPLDERFAVDVARIAAYAQDEWTISPAWSLYAGLRWEGVRTTSGGTVVNPSNNRSGVASPILQTLYKLGDGGSQLRFALARTYKAPAVGDLSARRIFSSANRASRPDYQGNPALRPELAWGVDLGWERFLGGGAVFGANLSSRRITDLTGRRLEKVDGQWVSMPVNEGQAVAHGVELEAKFPLSLLAAGLPAAELRFNLSRHWSRVSTIPGPDNRLDGHSPLTMNLGVDHRLTGVALTVGANFGFQEGGPVRTSPSQATFTSHQRTLDMFGMWKLDQATQLRLSLSNLLHPLGVHETAHDDEQGQGAQTVRAVTHATVRLALEHRY